MIRTCVRLLDPLRGSRLPAPSAALMEAVEPSPRSPVRARSRSPPPSSSRRWRSALLRAADRTGAAATAAIGVVHASGWLPDGQVSLGRWLERRPGLHGREANACVAGARSLDPGLLATRDAWLTGDISGSQAASWPRHRQGLARACPQQIGPPSGPPRRARSSRTPNASPPTAWPTSSRTSATTSTPTAPGRPRSTPTTSSTSPSRPSGRESSCVAGCPTRPTPQIRTALEQVVDGWHRDGELPDEDRIGCDGDQPAPRTAAPRAPSPPARPGAGPDLHRRPESGSLGTHHGLVPRITLTGSLDRLASGLGGDLLLPGHDNPAVVIPDTLRRFLCDAEITPIVTARPGSALGPIDLVLRESQRDRSSTSAATTASSHPACAARSSTATAIARSRAAGSTSGAAAPTTSSTGSTAAPTDLDNCVLLCERHHHDPSTKADGPSERPDATPACPATGPSPHPTDPRP